MNEPRYFAHEEEEQPELARLTLLEEIFDSTTIRHLEQIGPSAG